MTSTQIKLRALVTLPGNPKLHADADIAASLRRFGFVERVVVNEKTGHILSGHGRTGVLQQMHVAKEPPPVNIEVDADGDWLVPVDYVDLPEAEEKPVAVALNRLVEIGGWDDEKLSAIIEEARAAGDAALAGLGWNAAEIAKMLEDAPTAGEDLQGTTPASRPSVLVECESEDQQVKLLAKLTGEGWKCRAIM